MKYFILAIIILLPVIAGAQPEPVADRMSNEMLSYRIEKEEARGEVNEGDIKKLEYKITYMDTSIEYIKDSISDIQLDFKSMKSDLKLMSQKKESPIDMNTIIIGLFVALFGGKEAIAHHQKKKNGKGGK